MSEQGRCIHLHGITARAARTAVGALGVPCAIVASNRTWASIVPLDGAEPLLADVSRRAEATALQVCFDEDSAIVVQVAAPDGWEAELSVPLDESYAFGPEDQRYVASLVQRKLLSSRQARTIEKKLAASSERERWLRAHGLEDALGLPFTAALPVPCSEAVLRELVPKATVVRAAMAPAKSPTTGKPHDAKTRAWTDVERAIVDLHFHYLTALWSMNDWKVYNRYKKHLPAERRREVDGFVNLMMTGADDDALHAALDAIFATIWDAEDWLAVIRDPRILLAEPLDAADLADWNERVARVEARVRAAG